MRATLDVCLLFASTIAYGLIGGHAMVAGSNGGCPAQILNK
jgi:hypothetical protein